MAYLKEIHEAYAAQTDSWLSITLPTPLPTPLQQQPAREQSIREQPAREQERNNVERRNQWLEEMERALSAYNVVDRK